MLYLAIIGAVTLIYFSICLSIDIYDRVTSWWFTKKLSREIEAEKHRRIGFLKDLRDFLGRIEDELTEDQNKFANHLWKCAYDDEQRIYMTTKEYAAQQKKRGGLGIWGRHS